MATFRAAGAIFGFGILVLVLGLFLAPMVADTSTSGQQTVALNDGETESVQQNLDVEVSLDDNNNATVTVVDTQTYSQNTTTLTAGENATLTVSGESVGVTYDQFVQDYAVITAEYPPTFGFEDNTRAFYDNLGLILSLVGLMISLTGVVLGVRVA